MDYKWKSITKIELSSYFEDGLWYDEIGKLFGITGRSVRDKANKFGIQLDRKNKKKEPEFKVCIRCGKQYKTSINEGYCSSNCKKLIENTLEILEIPKDATELAIKIINERNLKLSVSEIARKLGCSKATVAYYCNDTTKQCVKDRVIRYKEDIPGWFYFCKNVTGFKLRKKGIGKVEKCKDWNKKFRTATSKFRLQNMEQNELFEYSYHDALEHVGGMKTKCYLTGDEINIETDNFNLDHIVPLDKGGSSELSNMGITIPEANASKTNLTVEEYIELCKKVLTNFGYSVTKEN